MAMANGMPGAWRAVQCVARWMGEYCRLVGDLRVFGKQRARRPHIEGPRVGRVVRRPGQVAKGHEHREHDVGRES